MFTDQPAAGSLCPSTLMVCPIGLFVGLGPSSSAGAFVLAHLPLRTVYPGASRAETGGGEPWRSPRPSRSYSPTWSVRPRSATRSVRTPADELLRAHFSVLRQAIAGSGGVEVKGLGDGVMVVFRSTSAALSCAVAMQQAVHRDNVGARHQLGLRIGLSGGEATMESNDYYGDPVIEAARLCAHADAGQILATDAVRVMAGRRSPYLFERLGALELKGLPEPVEVLEVRWEPLDEVAAENGVPLPARLDARAAHRSRRPRDRGGTADRRLQASGGRRRACRGPRVG